MTNEEKLQYAKDNYSIGDKISRRNFKWNRNTINILISTDPKENKHYIHPNNLDDDIFLGQNQIYCGDNGVWAKNLTRQNKTISNQEQYEIY